MNEESDKKQQSLVMSDSLQAVMQRNDLSEDETSIELSMRRTGLSFQRTRMSADRTLMSVMRTSLSLISFGFTIVQFFRSVRQSGAVGEGTLPATRNFGGTLVLLGIGMLIAGIVYHIRFMTELRKERAAMVEQGLVHGDLSYPISMTFITAFLLLMLGVIAFIGIVARSGPFD
ncbi:MAG TPA: DUF202 domain-containing protein [Pyrinomonadaceae bacterium]|jgi:putative membrane protein